MYIEDLLKQGRYRIVDYKLDEHYPEFEELYAFGFVGAYMFDELKKELGRIPTQREFIDEGTKRAESFFDNEPNQWLNKRREYHYFVWDGKLINCIENRLARSYFSFVLEEQVAEYVKDMLSARVTDNPLIDVVFGSDVTFVLEDKLYYVHITKNNRWSNEYLTDKGKKNVFVVDGDGHRRYWKRNWKKGHHLLTYNNRWESRMIDVNGNMLFDERYLEKWFDKMLQEENYDSYQGKSELRSFYEYMRKYNLEASEVNS